jgi:hypothetical protein
MSDYFFYDINKKMADLANKQTLAETAQAAPAKPAPNRLMEAAADYSAKKAAAGKDIGKPGKNFSKIAAGAAKRYGSAEAGKRVAGAVLNKLRHPSEGVDESALSTPISKAMKSGGTRSLPGLPMQPKPTDEGNAFSIAVVNAKKDGIQPGEQISVGGKQYPVKEAAKYRDPKYKDRLYTQEPGDNDDDDYMDLHWNDYGAKTRPKNDPGVKRRMGGVGSEFDRTDPLTKGFGRSGMGSPVEKGPRKGLPKRDQIRSLKGSIKDAHGTHVQPNLPEGEGGIPTTPKQKSFAKLAPPVDKITFADRIVGAKKEVDEMLGDVAANAMKNAVGQIDWTDDDRGRRRSSSGGRVDTTTPGVTRHTAGQRYSGAGHDASGDDEPTGAAGRRRVGPGQGTKIGAKINRGTSKLMTREGDMPEDMIEPHDSGEYDREGEMAKDDIKTVVRHAMALEKILGDNDNLPEWVQAKLAKIEGMMTAVDDYMQNQKSGEMETESTGSFASGATNPSDPTSAEWAELKRKAAAGDARAQAYVKQGMKRLGSEKYEPGTGDQTGNVAARTGTNLSPSAAGAGRGGAMDEESDNKRDSRAERAGKKVAKDIEYDEKEKDGIHGKKRDSEDSKAEKAGKKVTKDIEYDEKKNKKKDHDHDKDDDKEEVDETTSSGSVSTGGAATGKGHNYGKGIYDSMNRDVEKMISESMSINMSMNNDSHGGPSNTLTVTATDEDAKMLAGLLKMAGLGHGDDHIHAMTGDDSDMHSIHSMDQDMGQEPCPACGSTSCGCESMDEAYGDTDATDNEPDYPTDEVGTDDAMMYSGGMNGPKSTGQTTIPVIAHQNDRMGYEGDDALRRMMEMAGLREAAATPQAVDEPTNSKFKPQAPGSLIKVDPNKTPAAKATIPAAKAVPKIATPQAVDDPSTKIKEGLLMQLRNFKY